MTRLSGSCQAEIPFAIERCWAVASDVEHAPEWQRVLTAVTVIERDADGRPLIADTVNDAKLRAIRCRVRFDYAPPLRVSWTMVPSDSDDLDGMDGGWELVALGPDRTRATYALSVDPGPVGFLARPLERAIRPIVMGHQADELAAAVAARG